MSKRRAAVTVILSCSLGCSSSYVPASSPRLTIVMDGGQYSYVRDGKKFEGGFFGGDIDEAVRGNPLAEKYAHEYKNGLVTGFVVAMLGAAGEVAGLVVIGSDEAQYQSGQAIPPTGPVIALAGLAVEMVGLIVTANAFPHQFDAVNAYNDGVALPSPTAPAPQPPQPLPPPLAEPETFR